MRSRPRRPQSRHCQSGRRVVRLGMSLSFFILYANSVLMSCVCLDERSVAERLFPQRRHAGRPKRSRSPRRQRARPCPHLLLISPGPLLISPRLAKYSKGLSGSTLMASLNDNSRDSIFLTMDTITELLPSQTVCCMRYDDDSSSDLIGQRGRR